MEAGRRSVGRVLLPLNHKRKYRCWTFPTTDEDRKIQQARELWNLFILFFHDARMLGQHDHVQFMRWMAAHELSRDSSLRPRATGFVPSADH